MKFSLVFDSSRDTIPFEVKYNHELFEYFVEKANSRNQNSFSNDRSLYKEIDNKITNLHWAMSKTNEIFYELTKTSFTQQSDLENYLDQRYLNELHSTWVFSHRHKVNIDALRFGTNPVGAKIGNALHDLYPDDERFPDIAPALEKIGYLFPFQEINMAIHRLEHSFNSKTIEFKADSKWEVFDNPFVDTMVSNNDKVNLSFGYTYVGRQYYNKFRFFDTDLECPDNYNYEKLELSFQLNLSRPETIPFSKEAIDWANSKGIRLIAEQLPIANIVDLESNLFEYRKILYRNSRDNNRATIVLN